jgi:hypothetical protein
MQKISRKFSLPKKNISNGIENSKRGKGTTPLSRFLVVLFLGRG